jgi:uncharacterized Zn finger protein (UPF0148 family)
MPQPTKIGKINFSLGLVWIIMGVSVVRATGQNQPEMRIPMTPPNITVAPGVKLCGKGLHQYPEGLKACPQCLREYKKEHHLKNKEKYNKAFHDRYERIKNDPIEKEKSRKYRLKQYHKGYFKVTYYADVEASRQKTREYREKNKDRSVWENMIQRCFDPNHVSYKNYGGRGIVVCPQWLGKSGYKQFTADMGPRPSPQHSLDRRENDKGYSPDNCKWATGVEQGRNKRNNVNVEFKGKTQPISAWAEEIGVPYSVLYQRLKRRGWEVERAMTEPFQETSYSTHEALCERAKSWLYGQVQCHLAIINPPSGGKERPDVIGWRFSESWLIECKTNRRDFFREEEKSSRSDLSLGAGKFRYYLVPDNLVSVDEVPSGWGLLFVNGGIIVIAKEAVPVDGRNKDSEISMLVCSMRGLVKGKISNA